MKKLIFYTIPLALTFGFLFLFSFGATSHAAHFVAAASAPGASDPSLSDVWTPIYNALSGGHYAYAAAMLVIVMVALIKRYLAPHVAFLESDAGGSLLALAAATGTALASGLAAPDAVVSWALVKSSLLVGAGAAGGYAVIKNLLIDPVVIPLSKRAPAWMKPGFDAVLWIFTKVESDATGQTPIVDRAKERGTVGLRVLYALAIGGTILLASLTTGCAALKADATTAGKSLEACAKTDFGPLISTVATAIIANGADLESDLSTLAITAGKDAVQCAILAVGAVLAPTTPAAATKQPLPGLVRAKAWGGL